MTLTYQRLHKHMQEHQPYTYIAGRATNYSVNDMLNKGLRALESAGESAAVQKAGGNVTMEDGAEAAQEAGDNSTMEDGAEAMEDGEVESEDEEEPGDEEEDAAYRDADEELHPDVDDISMEIDMT